MMSSRIEELERHIGATQHCDKALMGLVILTLVVGGAVVSPSPAAAQVSASGWFHVVWGDPLAGSAAPRVASYVLIDDRGQWSSLEIDESLLASLGGPRVLDRRRVTVTSDSPTTQAAALRAHAIEAETAAAETTSNVVAGSQRQVTILCRFADSPSVTPHDLAWFRTLMGRSYPGMDHFWRELSYDAVDLAGSVVVGWYNLPRSRSDYLNDPQTSSGPSLNWQQALEDCTAAADADVVFPHFAGINLMFNENLDCCGWGGSGTLTRDGVTKNYAITWMTPQAYANHHAVGQAMGHGFGLPNASGGDSQTYDAQQVESCFSPHAQYGCLGVHTIALHKDAVGWIPAERRFMATAGTHTIAIERLARPRSSADYLMAQIPIGGAGSRFYTVEARRLAGYDSGGPGEGIVIHAVDTAGGEGHAQVVDTDGDGNPRASGALWAVGETFVDSANGVTVSVNSSTATSFDVTIGMSEVSADMAAVPLAPLPDLVVSNLPNPPGRAAAGSRFAASATIRNLGAARAGASTTSFRLSLDREIAAAAVRIGASSALASEAPARPTPSGLR